MATAKDFDYWWNLGASQPSYSFTDEGGMIEGSSGYDQGAYDKAQELFKAAGIGTRTIKYPGFGGSRQVTAPIDPQDWVYVAKYMSRNAPGRLAEYFQGTLANAAAGNPGNTDRAKKTLNGIVSSATPEEKAFIDKYALNDPNVLNGVLAGLGDPKVGIMYVKDDKGFIEKYWSPVFKAAVGGIITGGMGAALSPAVGAATGLGAQASSGLAGAGIGGLTSYATGGNPLVGALAGGIGGYYNPEVSGLFGGGLAGGESANTLSAAGGEVLGNAAEAPLGDLIMGGESWDTLGNFLSGPGFSTGADAVTGAVGGGLGMSNLLGKAAAVPGNLLNKAIDNPLAALSVLGGTALGLGTASGNDKNLTTESMSSVDPRYWQYAEPMLQQGLGMLPSQMQQTNAMQPQLNQTLGGLLNAPNVESNPWVRGWGDALSSDTWNQWQQNAIPSIASAFSMAGRGGGQSGGNMAYSNAIGKSAADTARGLNANLAGLYSGAYGQGLNAAQGGLTQAPSVSQMGWLPLQNYSNLLGTMPWNRTTTSTQPGVQSNPWAGALGGALTGASLWRNLNGGW